MEVKEKVVEKTVKVYELTEDELNKIKKEERYTGRREAIGYISFALSNYKYKLNTGGCIDFLNELLKFLQYKTATIPNTYEYSFKDYLEKHWG